MRISTTAFLAALALTGLAGTADAATCTGTVATSVTQADGGAPTTMACELGVEDSDKISNGKANEWSVNIDGGGVFGGGWTGAERSNSPGTDNGSLDFASLANGTSGMFQLVNGFWDKYSAAMITFDASGDKVAPKTYVSYLLTPNTYKYYTYVTPFTKTTGSSTDTQAIQQITLYTKPIPLPPAALLFGSALSGIGFLSRRRAKAGIKAA